MTTDGSPWLRGALLLPILLTIISPISCQYNQFVTTVAPGSTSWYPNGNGNGVAYTVRSDPPSGTVTVTTDLASGATGTAVIPARSIPTLVYNCKYMPFICKNIENHVANQGDWKFDSNGLMELHLDVVGEDNNEKRRRQTCKNKRSLYGLKGYPKKCDSIGSITGIDTVWSKQFPLGLPAKSVDKQPKIILGPVDPTDPNKNYASGLMYTCDEFPSARYVKNRKYSFYPIYSSLV